MTENITGGETTISNIEEGREKARRSGAKDLTEGEYKYDSVEDIRKIEIVAIEELKHMISEGNVENAGTLIGYLLCCTGIL